MIRVTNEAGEVYEIGCEVEKTEDSCTFEFNYEMECVCKDAPEWIDRKESAEMMAQYCEMLFYPEGRRQCFSVMPPVGAECVLKELLEKEGYKVEAFPEEDDSPGYDEYGRQIIY